MAELSEAYEGETDRQRREREAAAERAFFTAWWDAYKIALTKAPSSGVLMTNVEVANAVELEYRKRHASMMEALAAIWKGYAESDDWKWRTGQ
jgi:hypothetical protein